MKKVFLRLFLIFGIAMIYTSANAQSRIDSWVEVPSVPPAVIQSFERDFGWYLDGLDLLNIQYQIHTFRQSATPVSGWPFEYGSLVNVMLYDGDKFHHFPVRYRSNGDAIWDDDL